jgi:Ser/Thr protein kinase RdoA (MazF antagonist)
VRDYHDLTPIGRARRLRQVVAAALEHYELEAARVRLITNETNGIFRIDTTDGRKLVARVGLGGEIGHSTGQVKAETDWLVALDRETDLSVPVPLSSRDGRRFVTVGAPGVPDRRNVVIFSWLSGVPLDERLTDETVDAYGALAAALHRHGRQHRPADPAALARYDRAHPFDEAVVLFDPDDRLMPPGRRAIFESARERVEEAVRRLRGSGEAMRILHGDLHPWNVMVGRRGLAPFDFEDLMWGWPIQDIATSLYYFEGRPGFEERVTLFRSGYETVGPWPERRAGELTAFLMARCLVLANDVIITPEWAPEAATWLERFEGRLRRLGAG